MPKTISIAATLAAIIALAPLARAGERVTLTNGFSIDCHHRGEVEGRVRLYIDHSEDSYIEVAPENIVAVEKVSVLPQNPQSSASPATAPSTVITAAGVSAKPKLQQLNPADLHEMLAKAGQEHNLDVDLLASLVNAESGGNARAVSRAGARGLMQLMPTTASYLGVQDSMEPRQNLNGGSAYLDSLLTRYHENLALALAAYNAGPAAVDKYHGIPPYAETRAYVARVIHEFNRRVAARQSAAHKSTARGVAVSNPSLAVSLP